MPPDFFDRADEEDRRARVATAIVENERLRALEAEVDEARRARGRIFSLRANARLLADQYRAAGVSPPRVNGLGEPTCSLTLLLSVGWRIEETTRDEAEHGGEVRRELVRPSAIPPERRARGRNDEQGS